MFKPSPYLAPEVNRAIIQSEIEGGVNLALLPIGKALEVTTRNRVYLLRKIGETQYTISGHPQFCPDTRECRILGSTYGGSMLRMHYLGRGMYMEFWIEGETYTTSQIQEIREL